VSYDKAITIVTELSSEISPEGEILRETRKTFYTIRHDDPRVALRLRSEIGAALGIDVSDQYVPPEETPEEAEARQQMEGERRAQLARVMREPRQTDAPPERQPRPIRQDDTREPIELEDGTLTCPYHTQQDLAQEAGRKAGILVCGATTKAGNPCRYRFDINTGQVVRTRKAG
jgi:hypothetical protein